ncbi:cytochrome C oxidase copper chaperone [Ancylostoma duodenale]|uniref:Cytochrome C oxidase copper chaperone n=1 Tax=Ancylostoma duodenale TaxID=51022 RepID=A0A0C2GL87_9BILA|nr:cytochrome C oxidase copper chaperone [Ancylostoma duodenale]
MPEEKKCKSESSGCDVEKKLKPCCACPETKKARDQCIIENGEENCGELIEAHKKCLRDAGFDI